MAVSFYIFFFFFHTEEALVNHGDVTLKKGKRRINSLAPSQEVQFSAATLIRTPQPPENLIEFFLNKLLIGRGGVQESKVDEKLVVSDTWSAAFWKTGETKKKRKMAANGPISVEWPAAILALHTGPTEKKSINIIRGPSVCSLFW